MSKESDGGAGFIAGFVLGGVAGAALALFLAPRSGEDGRSAVRDRTIELRIRAEEAAAKAREEADELLARGKVLFDEQKAKVQEAVEEGRGAADQKRSELMSRYRVAKETGEVPLEDDLPQTPRPETTGD